VPGTAAPVAVGTTGEHIGAGESGCDGDAAQGQAGPGRPALEFHCEVEAGPLGLQIGICRVVAAFGVEVVKVESRNAGLRC